jgi:hypothetical protein
MAEELLRIMVCDACGQHTDGSVSDYIRRGWAVISMDCFDGSDKREDLAFCSRKCLTDYFTKHRED